MCCDVTNNRGIDMNEILSCFVCLLTHRTTSHGGVDLMRPLKSQQEMKKIVILCQYLFNFFYLLKISTIPTRNRLRLQWMMGRRDANSCYNHQVDLPLDLCGLMKIQQTSRLRGEKKIVWSPIRLWQSAENSPSCLRLMAVSVASCVT